MNANTLLIASKPPFPNAELPVLLYPQALAPGGDYAALFRKSGWRGIWVNGVYTFDHFHADAHEALGCIAGWARLRLGGPEGIEVTVKAGDAVLLPAGTGHRNLAQSADFSVVGAYPPGQSPDMQQGDMSGYEGLLARARAVPLPDTDPVAGAGGAVRQHWHKENE